MWRYKILYGVGIFSEVMMMDKIDVSLIGLGIIVATQLVGSLTHNKANDEKLIREEMQQQQEFILPGIALNEFVSARYKVGFKYPKSWNKNPRYEDKYEGETGFFEVGAFEGPNDIDAAVKEQINEYYKPYGSNPTVRSFIVDGQPARVIYPSEDQPEFYKDRDAAIVVKYPEPIAIDGQKFDYVIIWVTKDYVPLIISTFQFVK